MILLFVLTGEKLSAFYYPSVPVHNDFGLAGKIKYLSKGLQATTHYSIDFMKCCCLHQTQFVHPPKGMVTQSCSQNPARCP